MRIRPTSIYILITALNLLPIWIAPYLPTQDGPIHLSIANVLLHYNDAATPIFRQYYDLSLIFHPNWLAYVLLVPLLTVFSPPIAEKLLVSAYIVSFPLAIWYLVSGLKREVARPPFLMLPFVFNYTILIGFYNFALSLPMLFFVLGYWFRIHRAITIPRLVLLSALGIVLYLTHIFSFVVCLMTVLVVTPIREIASSSSPTTTHVRSGLMKAGRSVSLAFLGFLPGLVLAVQYLTRQGVALEGQRPVFWKLQGLVGVGALMTLDRLTVVPGVAMAAILALLAGYVLLRTIRERKRSDADGLLFLSALFLALYTLMPDVVSGGSFVLHRLNLFFFLFLALWLSLRDLPAAGRRLGEIGAVAIAVGLLLVHTVRFERMGEYYEEYMSAAPYIAENSTLLPLRSWDNSLLATEPDPFGWRVHPFLHAAGYIAADRRVVSLDNYQATQGYFPIAYRPPLSPYTYLNHPHRTFVDYPSKTGGRIDYILLWSPPADIRVEGVQRDEKARAEIEERLKDRYELIARSPRSGAMRLYKLKADPQAGIASPPADR